jgi:hypothetical protein
MTQRSWSLAGSVQARRVLERLQRRRGERGVTMVEYIAILSFVVLPGISAAVACFVQVVFWFARFVSAVSQPGP